LTITTRLDDLNGEPLLWSIAVRALIGLTLLMGGALGGLEHVTQQNPALLVPLWTSVGLTDGAALAAKPTQDTDVNATPARDKTVFQTLAVADTTPVAPPINLASVDQSPAALKTADVIVPPVKRVKPVTPPAEPVAVAAPEVKTAAVAAAGAIAVAAAAKTAKVFAGRSTLGGPVPAATPPAPVAVSKPAAKATKQATAKTPPAASVQKRPGFKLTCTAAQKLDVEKQRCVSLKGKLATATAKPKA
jgi:hypothetical protein